MSGLPVSICAIRRTSPTASPQQRVAWVACLTRRCVSRLLTMDMATAVNTRSAQIDRIPNRENGREMMRIEADTAHSLGGFGQRIRGCTLSLTRALCRVWITCCISETYSSAITVASSSLKFDVLALCSATRDSGTGS
jgi:hypothetical protein